RRAGLRVSPLLHAASACHRVDFAAVSAAAMPRTASHIRRVIEATLFVGVLIALGLLLDFRDSNYGITAYLLMTSAATVLFQRFVARQPLRWMWVKGTDRPVNRRTISPVVLVAAAIYPAYALVQTFIDGAGWQTAYTALAIFGAVGVGFAFRQSTKMTWMYLWLCMATAGLIGTLMFLLGAFETITHPTVTKLFGEEDAGVFFRSLILYIPTMFVMEEVTFRGCVDSHCQHDGDRQGFWTALWVSVLWSWWHLGCLPDSNPINVLPLMVPVGIFLSIWWRRSRNLGVSGVTHAFIDSVRNSFGDIP
ncbi:MAG: CPBP family glutamic-type intramembrane protease, partial [Acidimicrobiia bacterium]